VAVSEAQRRALPTTNWEGTIHHGLPRNGYTFRDRSEPYLAFVGSIVPWKGLHQAIEIAIQAEMKIVIAAKRDNLHQKYFQEVVEPLLNGRQVIYLAEIDDLGKQELLGRAHALLFPIAWPEPFGLVMIEALACGTPVVAFSQGSVPEVIENGVSGFVVQSTQDAVKAIRQITPDLRKRCRDLFEQRFNAVRMTEEYIAVYRKLVK
jgi:glycosyltransferase involved in cell wall biosynthesis